MEIKSLIMPECILFKAPYEFCMFITRSRIQYTWTRDLCNNHCCAFRCLCRTSLMRAPVNLCVYFLMTLATMSYQFYSIAKPNPIVDDQLNHCHQVARQYDTFGSQSISKCNLDEIFIPQQTDSKLVRHYCGDQLLRSSNISTESN